MLFPQVPVCQRRPSGSGHSDAGTNTCWQRTHLGQHFRMLMTRENRFHQLYLTGAEVSQSLLTSHTVTGILFCPSSDMVWTLLLLFCGLSVCLASDRTVTFHRTRRDVNQNLRQELARSRRESSAPSVSSSSFRLSHGPPFTSCPLPLSPAEHRVLDDNTHEVTLCVYIFVCVVCQEKAGSMSTKRL